MTPPTNDYPSCFCVPSTRWEDRRDDGNWDADLYDVLQDGTPGPVLHQRTCMKCGASKCIEVAALVEVAA